MLMVLDELKKHCISLDVASVISDFELNIVKAVDEMLETETEGCFFHFQKNLQEKVDKKGFKTRYEKDIAFQKFVKECGAIAFLPLEDIDKGMDIIEMKHNFDDEKGIEFKSYFINYLRTYWLNGCLPPQVWNCWSRTEDLTNNHQEGYNAKTNRVLRQTHPSPGILLCHVRSELKLAEQLLAQARVGIEKPRAQPKYMKLAKRRWQIMKIYQDEKKGGKADVSSFLSNMGHNLLSSLNTGKANEIRETVNPRESLLFEGGPNHDISTWVPQQDPELSALDKGDNPYSDRIIGLSKKNSDASNNKLTGKKCPSCDSGFNRLSKTLECHSCDSLTHKSQLSFFRQ